MITLKPIGHVRSSPADLSDDNWASRQAGTGPEASRKNLPGWANLQPGAFV